MKNKLEPGKAYTLKGQYFDDKYGVGAKAYIEDTTENVLGEDWIEKMIPVIVVFIARMKGDVEQFDPITSFPTQTYYAKVTRFGEVAGGLGEIITSNDIFEYEASDEDFHKWLTEQGIDEDHNSIELDSITGEYIQSIHPEINPTEDINNNKNK